MEREAYFQPNFSTDSGSPAITEVAEKRQHERVPVSLGAEIIDLNTRVCIEGRATDFGVGGCYVDTMNTLAQGTAIDLFLYWQERKLHLRAVVSYVANGRSIGMGLSFTGASAEEGATLMDWVTGLSGVGPRRRQQAPAPEPATKGKLSGTSRLEETIGQLIALLVSKEVLTHSEGTRLREKLYE